MKYKPDYLIEGRVTVIVLFSQENATIETFYTLKRSLSAHEGVPLTLFLKDEAELLFLTINDKKPRKNEFKRSGRIITILNVPEEGFVVRAQTVLGISAATELLERFTPDSFLKFLPHPDPTYVRTDFRMTLTADKTLYPTLPSYGEVVSCGDRNGTNDHFVTTVIEKGLAAAE